MILRKIYKVKQHSVQRFLEKVLPNEDGCWYWQAALIKGYGTFRLNPPPTTVYAHRYMYELVKGVIPVGLCVLHTCDHPSCVNPKHLWVGTNQENTDDMLAKGRKRAAFGAALPQTKLCIDQVKEIRRLYIPNVMGYKKLAKLFNLSPSTVYAIVKRKIWKQLL